MGDWGYCFFIKTQKEKYTKISLSASFMEGKKVDSYFLKFKATKLVVLAAQVLAC